MNELRWTLLREFAAQFEADLAIGVLERNDVPVRVDGAPVGIFGPDFSGATSAGVRILVPDDRVDEAMELLKEWEVTEQ